MPVCYSLDSVAGADTKQAVYGYLMEHELKTGVLSVSGIHGAISRLPGCAGFRPLRFYMGMGTGGCCFGKSRIIRLLMDGSCWDHKGFDNGSGCPVLIKQKGMQDNYDEGF